MLLMLSKTLLVQHTYLSVVGEGFLQYAAEPRRQGGMPHQKTHAGATMSGGEWLPWLAQSPVVFHRYSDGDTCSLRFTRGQVTTTQARLPRLRGGACWSA